MSTAADAWTFLLWLHAQPGIAERCLELQNRHGIEVNALLFAAWVGISGQGSLDTMTLWRLRQAGANWRREVVEPLRELRTRLKGQDEELFRDQVKTLELEAERRQIEKWVAGLPEQLGSVGDPLEDALEAMAGYVGEPWDDPLEQLFAGALKRYGKG